MDHAHVDDVDDLWAWVVATFAFMYYILVFGTIKRCFAASHSREVFNGDMGHRVYCKPWI